MEYQSFSNRIKWYNFILCILVILIHAENTGIFPEAVPWLNRVEYVVVEEFARISIAGFFLCSGYLYYRNFTWKKLPGKWKSRCFSTLVPFAVWNLVYYAIHAVLAVLPGLSRYFGDGEVPLNLGELLRAVVFYTYNPVFWFLQFLIVFICASPLVYLFLRNKWIGFAAIFGVFVLAVSGQVTIYNDTAGAMANWLFIYLVGSYMGLHFRQKIEEGQYKGWIFAGLFLGTAAAFYIWRQYPSLTWTLLYYLLGAVTLWYLLGIVRLVEPKAYMENTFYIYAVHFMIVKFGTKLWHVLAGDSMYAGIVIFFLMPAITVLFCYYSSRILKKYVPFLWKILSGNR